MPFRIRGVLLFGLFVGGGLYVALAEQPPQSTATTPVPEFAAADADGDGYVSRRETPAMPGDLFARADRNDDGRLDAKEYAHTIHMSEGQPSQGIAPDGGAGGSAATRPQAPDFAQLDRNTDGVLTTDELHDRPQVAEQWRTLDANSDGVVDRSEFAAFVPAGSDQYPTNGEGPGASIR